MSARPIRILLLRELAFLSGIVIPLVAALSWFGLTHVLRAQAAERATESLRSLEVQIEDRLARIDEAATSLAFLWREGLLDPMRPEEARLFVFPLLGQLPGTGSVMLVRASDGFSFFVVRTGDTYRNETLRPIDEGHSDVTITVEDLEGHVRPPFTQRLPYHPLHRPWIEEARGKGKPFWSAPYEFKVFLDTPRERHVGITHGVPVYGVDGASLGYVGIDVVLADFSALCAAVRPTPNSVVAVLDDEGRILGASESPAGAPLLARPAADRLPMLHALLEEPDPATKTVKVQKRSWLARSSPLVVRGGRDWRIALAIPEDDLIGAAREQVLWLLALLLALFAAAAVRTMLLTRRLSSGLSSLAAAAQNVGRSGPLALPQTSVAEIASVGSALERSHESLEAQKRLEDQLMHSQRIGMVGFLAGGLAHDVSNQLTLVLGELSAARAQLPRGTPSAESLERAERACWRSVEAVRGLVGLSRRGTPSFKAININDVVTETAALVERVLDSRTTLEMQLGHELPIISADPIQIEQVLLNLALNARDAMPRGGVIRLETTPAPGGGVKVSVRDTGTGMTADVRAHLFEPFFTTKEPGKGTGLGLAMVSSIVRQHGGRIEVETAPGRGSTFVIQLAPEPELQRASA